MTEQHSGKPPQPDPEPGPGATADPTGTGAPAAGSAGEGSPGAGNAESGPPPLTAFAWRNNLVRPTRGRMLAGVCGALGRASNSDPVLWRVLIAVLAIFGGIGVVVYLLGWLLLPADGDTASPVEALFMRGRSATSSALAVVGLVVLLLSLPVIISEPLRPGPWGIVLIAGALLLLLRDRRRSGTPPNPSPPPPPAAPSGAPMTTTAPATPFAPHGPYAPSTSTAYPPPAYPPPAYAPPSDQPPPFPPAGHPRPAPPPRPPKPPRVRSRLGRLIFSLLLLTVGVMGMFDLAGHSIPTPAYFAAALAVVGVGLILGTWFGRARGMIALGILLMVGTGGAFAATEIGPGLHVGKHTWVVTSVSQLEPSYTQQVGDGTLDLEELDLSKTTGTVNIEVSIKYGRLEIIVPRRADVTLDARVDYGDVEVFDQSWGGFDNGTRTVTDYGPDGRGGGDLHITASVDAGQLEVRR